MQPDNPIHVRGRTVLIVEPEYLVGACLSADLAEMGAIVAPVMGRPADALSLIDGGNRIDLAIVDWHEPNNTADRLISTLARRRAEILIATALVEEDLPVHLRRLACLTKPFVTRLNFAPGP
mgnify:FL=1